MKPSVQAKVASAKQNMEHQIVKLYEEFHSCKDPQKRAEIKSNLDMMILEAEAKKESTKVRQAKSESSGKLKNFFKKSDTTKILKPQ
jgi:hypothetical protein